MSSSSSSSSYATEPQPLSTEETLQKAGTKRSSHAAESRKLRRLAVEQDHRLAMEKELADMQENNKGFADAWLGMKRTTDLQELFKDCNNCGLSRDQLNKLLLDQAQALQLTVQRLMVDIDTQEELAVGVTNAEQCLKHDIETGFHQKRRSLVNFQCALRSLAKESDDAEHPLLAAFQL